MVDIIGSGTMGGAIAGHLRDAEMLSAVYDIDPAYSSVESIAKLQADNVIMCLPNDAAVYDSVLQILDRKDSACQNIINMSTSSPELAKQCYSLCRQSKICYLEAPMIGGVRAVKAKRLAVIIGGDEDRYLRLRWLFEIFCKKLFYVGSCDAAARYKLVHNSITIANSTVAMEALKLGESLGLARDKMFEIFGAGTANSYVLQNTLNRTILNSNYSEGFKLKLAAKDMGLVTDLAYNNAIKLNILRAVSKLYAKAEDLGEDLELDYPIINKLMGKHIDP